MPTEPMLIDGKRGLGLEYIEFVRGQEVSEAIRLVGGRVPLVTDTDLSAVPAFAEVNFGRWIARCPQARCGGASYVWINGPHIFLCLVCANLGIVGRYRPVIVPDNWQQIEAILFVRHVVTERNWIASMTVADLLLENHQLGYTIPSQFEAEAEAVISAHSATQAELTRMAEEQAATLPTISPEDLDGILQRMPAVIPPESTEA